MNNLPKYCIGKIREGHSEFNINKALHEMELDHHLVIYRDDVYTYYFSVPNSIKNEIGHELLEFFYRDNYDYSEEMKQDFINQYPEYFEKE